MTCEERRELLLLHAAGALGAAETQTLLAHMASGCPRCLGALAEAQAVLAHLPLALPPEAPPPGRREQLMARVRAESARTAIAMATARPAYERLPRLLAMGIAAGLVCMLLAFPIWRRNVAKHERELAALREQLGEQTAALGQLVQSQAAEIERLQADMAEANRTAGLLRAPGLLLVSLRGDAQPEASGRIFWDRDNRTWHFFADNLAPSDPGKTYELWFITASEEKVRAGVFDVDAEGRGHLVVAVPENLGQVALAAVTDEPAGGVEQPTGKIQLVGAVPAPVT